MKKNIMMRVASVMLIAVLLSTCTISGTFAKYVTTESAQDQARVAKWGVGITTTGYLFAEQYKDEPIASASDDTITVQVIQSAKENVVAPGTQNTTGFTFTLTGAPEVDVKLDVVATGTDIVLPAKTGYTDYTAGNADKTFDLADNYYPVVFTLANGAGKTLKQGTMADIVGYLNGMTTAKIDSNTDLATAFTSAADPAIKTDGTYKLTWAWAFTKTPDVIETDDKADTYIGNVMAGTVIDATCKTRVSFDLTITVTQIN